MAFEGGFDGGRGLRQPGNGVCPFCDRDAMEIMLAESERFVVLADNAPLVEGHLLIVPREHYTCFGAAPAAFDDELLTLKDQAMRFCADVYRPASFFEHGVFGQSVPHAHLHVVPLGATGLGVHELATPGGQPVRSLADVRAWYEERGHYFYLESPPNPADPYTREAAVFPPDEGPYVRVLRMLRERSHVYNPWQPQFMRRMGGQPKMRALAEKWQEYHVSVRGRVGE
jgi:diadenosine tetraphosphate (Ap4A) HIT family hydrolase